jgi:hypothetical protein
VRLSVSHSFQNILAATIFLMAPLLLAQSTQSTILGTVKDTTGAMIPGATIKVTNVDEGVTATYRTDASGNYQALELPPGAYRLQVSRTGFETKLIEGLQLSARQQLRSDVTLSVAGTQQEVVVNASSEGAINTETASISATLSEQNVSDLPTNYYGAGTSPLYSIQVLPGVQTDNGSAGGGVFGSLGNMGISVQGGQSFQTEASIDGISAQNVRWNVPLADAFPSAESISEIRVDGVNNNAEFGQAGEITVVTKSGTNQYHGVGSWHYQDSALDAKAFGQTTKPQLQDNDFGISVGGPASIPHLYNGHDKTFFFATYEGYRFPQQFAQQEMVPTQAMLNGDFSSEFPTTPLINPADGTTYSNNMITSINPSAKPFLSLFPTPNYPSSAPYSTIAAAQNGDGYNYTVNSANNYDSNQFDVRVDHHFSPKTLLFARYTFKNITALQPQSLNVPSATGFDNYRILASSLIHNFTPNLLNEFRFGFTIEYNGERNILNGQPYTNAAGFDSVSGTFPINGETVVVFPSTLTSLYAGNYSSTTQSHFFDYDDNLIWVRGAHTVKAGADIRAFQSISTLGNATTSNVEGFAFYGLYTSAYDGALLGTSFSGAAYQFADFLTGAPIETEYFSLVPKDDGATTFEAFYAQDQWRITPRLTLSYGLRYEFDPAMRDTTGNIGNFDPSVPTTGAVIYPAGYESNLDAAELAQFGACGYGPAVTPYAACTPVLSSSQAGLPAGLHNAQKDRLLPRVGLAWRPFNDDKTAVTAGFGMYNISILGSSFYAMTDQLQAAALTYTNLEGAPYYPPTYMWPQTSPGTGITPNYGTADFEAGNQINWKNPYSLQWNLSLERESKGNIGARISYIGMRTDDLVVYANENPLSYSSTTPALSRQLTDRPFPNWGYISDCVNGAQAFFNELQIEVSRRLQRGLTFDSTYTWAKNLADNMGTTSGGFVGEVGNYVSDVHNIGLDYGNVYGTRRQRWISTGLYELPVGRGRSFGANMSRAADALVGGWQLSGIFLIQTGPYIEATIPGGDADPSGTGSGTLYNLTLRPDMTGNPVVPSNRTRNQWLNPAAFACPSNTGYSSASYAGNPCGVGATSNPIGRFGNESTGNVLGPGTVNLSAGLDKDLVIKDNYRLRFESTFTNVLNHTNLNDPNTNITDPDFGKITGVRNSDFGGARTGQIALKLQF